MCGMIGFWALGMGWQESTLSECRGIAELLVYRPWAWAGQGLLFEDVLIYNCLQVLEIIDFWALGMGFPALIW